MSWRINVGALIHLFYLCCLCFLITGCAAFHDESKPIPVADGAADVLLPAGNYHLMSFRRLPSATEPIVCLEPSPDWATSLGTTIKVTAQGSAPGGTTAKLGAQSQTTEAITSMLGRTAGVVALRDGLYSACQAYANGVIGKDAYALIISQYGNLLIMLVSGSATGQVLPGTDPKSTSDLAVAMMRQQMLQAMLVACITDQDPTRGVPEETDTSWTPEESKVGILPLMANRNPLLADYCPEFMAAVDANAGNLIIPDARPAHTPQPKPVKPQPKPGSGKTS